MIDQCIACTEPYCDSCSDVLCECGQGMCQACADARAEMCRECGDQHTADMEALG